MDKRIIILIVSLLTAVTLFMLFRFFFSSKEKIQVNYVIRNIKNNTAQKDSDVLFADQTVDAVEWKWNFGDDQYSFDKEPTHVYNAVGTFRVRLTVTTSKGSETDTSKVIKVIESNPVVVTAPVEKKDTAMPKPAAQAPVLKPVSVEKKLNPKPSGIKPKSKHQSPHSKDDDKIYDLPDQDFKK